MMKIYLSKGEYATVDDDDYLFLSKIAWHCHVNARNGKKYAQHNYHDNGVTRCVKMHRMILKVDDGTDVDHIDGNGLNNTKSNLRPATRSMNRANTPKQRNNTSGYKGVGFLRNLWQANIKVNQKQIYLGCFPNKEEAARAYDNAAKKYFGKFAFLNFPDEKFSALPAGEPLEAQERQVGRNLGVELE